MNVYREEEYLQLSGIQHFAFCRRQWALIQIEHQWAENARTTDGALMHNRAHDGAQREKRGSVLTLRGIPLSSSVLGLSGQSDIVEFHEDESGVFLVGYEGRWRPYPVEYKRGEPKVHDADRLQLCAQAMCLEEMLVTEIPEGALFYGETRRRERVDFSDALRQTVRDCCAEMHELYRRGYTPKVKTGAFCRACSLSALCLPKLCKNRSAQKYLLCSLETEDV